MKCAYFHMKLYQDTQQYDNIIGMIRQIDITNKPEYTAKCICTLYTIKIYEISLSAVSQCAMYVIVQSMFTM